MVHNSFLGKSEIVSAMLDNPKSPFAASALQRRLLRTVGPGVIRLFGWPLRIEQRLRALIILRFLGTPQGKLLDVGGSYGILAFELARQGWQVAVVDINVQNLRLGEAIKEIIGIKNVSFH
jgi:2-polyprenyl-3-methyl-5-hydroxy-6-metoxy-1,4-benzoquinol methylase